VVTPVDLAARLTAPTTVEQWVVDINRRTQEQHWKTCEHPWNVHPGHWKADINQVAPLEMFTNVSMAELT